MALGLVVHMSELTHRYARSIEIAGYLKIRDVIIAPLDDPPVRPYLDG